LNVVPDKDGRSWFRAGAEGPSLVRVLAVDPNGRRVLRGVEDTPVETARCARRGLDRKKAYARRSASRGAGERVGADRRVTRRVRELRTVAKAYRLLPPQRACGAWRVLFGRNGGRDAKGSGGSIRNTPAELSFFLYTRQAFFAAIVAPYLKKSKTKTF
jgi:hypothetical protein